MINQPQYVMIYTDKLRESIEFYEDIFGCEVKWQFAEYCGFTNGIILHSDADPLLKRITYFNVDNTYTLINSIRDKLTILKEPTEILHGTLAVVQDNVGNPIAVIDSQAI
jgi:predicted enzyme related to lactoylglutathione lyase